MVDFGAFSDVKLYNAFLRENFTLLELFVPICGGCKDENLQKVYGIMSFILQIRIF